MNVGELLEEGRRELEGRSDTARLDVQLLLAHVLERDRTWLYTWPDKPVVESDATRYRELLARRAAGEPVAHILGTRDFWTLTLLVSPATLIPRPDTELLVELALARGPSGSARVLDLGTGTGAIALALASERPDWCLVAVDHQPEAVDLARENARRLAIDNIEIRQSDWFESVRGRFDLILSNPPYIDPDDPHLDRGDVRFEPRSALVAQQGGLADLAFIIATAADYLVPGGRLLVEHGADQGEPVRGLFAREGYTDIATATDLAGLERVTRGRVA